MLENPIIAFPKACNCVPNVSNVAVPVTNDVIDEIRSASVNVNTNSANIFAALTVLSSIELAVAINGVAFCINIESCVPRSANVDPKLKNDDTPATKLAADTAKIAPVKIPTPTSARPSTVLIPLMNGVTFAINNDKFAPISGKPDEIPAPTPPTILPTNLPIA